MIVYTPPTFPSLDFDKPSLFLAGSIEMGKAINWQSQVIDQFKECDITIFNPRRNDWDSSWVQSIKNPQFFQQVSWELQYLQQSKYKIFYFASKTISPITLLEFGTFAKQHFTYNFVCWEDNYERAGNLEVYCNVNNIRRYDSLNHIVETIKTKLNNG